MVLVVETMRVALKKPDRESFIHSFCLTSVTEKYDGNFDLSDPKKIRREVRKQAPMLVLLIYHSNANARPFPNLRAKITPLWLLSLRVVSFPYSE